MELQRQEYPALLSSLQPEQAVEVLNNRVALISQINISIADFLQERRKIEERYAAELYRLARRPQQDSAAALGVFQLPWQRIILGTENLAQSHETLAARIETDVEAPLKQYATKNREMQNLSTIQGNLGAICKELTRAREKAGKLSAKGSKKAGDASSSVEDASREWDSQAPFVFEQLQSLDEHRVNHLRDVLTQFQTHEVDQIERNRVIAETCLNALLSIETADEIKTFAAKVQQNAPAPARRSSVTTSDARPSSSGILPPAPPPPRNQDQRLRGAPSEDRQTPGSLNVHNSSGHPLTSPAPEPTPQKSKMGGLKRLGTVMSRRKSAAPPPPQLGEKKKEKTRSMMPFRRGDSSRSFQDLEATGQDLTPVPSQSERGSSRQGPTPLDVPPQVQQNANNVASYTANGLQNPPQDTPGELQQPLAPQPQPTAQINTPPAVRYDPFAQATAEAGAFSAEADESARNLKIRDQPIQEDAGEAQLAMNNVANQLRLQAQTSGMNRTLGSVRGRRDVRNTMFIPGTQEIPGLSQSATNGGLPTVLDVPSDTAASPISQPVQPAAVTGILEQTPVKRSGTGATTLDDHTISDATSIHSSQSLATVAHHPELHEPGLNASIVETVSTWFTESGITKSFVVGEIAFACVNTPSSFPQVQEAIRLQNFQVLEKVAANPTFVTSYKSINASAEEQAGSYTVSLSAIRRPVPVVGLKYQLHLDEANQAKYTPVNIIPAWQIIQGQASVIVMYSLNPAFTSHISSAASTVGEITLKNVVISVSLDIKDPSAGKPTTAMMAPTQGASFRRKAGSVIWRFPEMKVTGQQERLLVRFVTEGDVAKKGAIELKFDVADIIASQLGVEKSDTPSAVTESDPFADAATPGPVALWTPVPTRRLLTTGRYSAT